jgi:hypothetical protein
VILLSLLDAASPSATSDRSRTDWGYDVSKNVASAVVVAFLVAVVGKAIGWTLFARLRWRSFGSVLAVWLLMFLITYLIGGGVGLFLTMFSLVVSMPVLMVLSVVFDLGIERQYIEPDRAKVTAPSTLSDD